MQYIVFTKARHLQKIPLYTSLQCKSVGRWWQIHPSWQLQLQLHHFSSSRIRFLLCACVDSWAAPFIFCTSLPFTSISGQRPYSPQRFFNSSNPIQVSLPWQAFAVPLPREMHLWRATSIHQRRLRQISLWRNTGLPLNRQRDFSRDYCAPTRNILSTYHFHPPDQTLVPESLAEWRLDCECSLPYPEKMHEMEATFATVPCRTSWYTHLL